MQQIEQAVRAISCDLYEVVRFVKHTQFLGSFIWIRQSSWNQLLNVQSLLLGYLNWMNVLETSLVPSNKRKEQIFVRTSILSKHQIASAIVRVYISAEWKYFTYLFKRPHCWVACKCQKESNRQGEALFGK